MTVRVLSQQVATYLDGEGPHEACRRVEERSDGQVHHVDVLVLQTALHLLHSQTDNEHKTDGGWPCELLSCA